ASQNRAHGCLPSRQVALFLANYRVGELRCTKHGMQSSRVAFVAGAHDAGAQNYSTGAVNIYSTCGLNPDLSNRIEAANRFRGWYNFAGFPIVSRWENDNVFNTDFTDGPGKDMDPGGGSDAANIYLFAGHGSCQNPPGANDPDFVVTCSHGAGMFTDIGASSRWGNAGGHLLPDGPRFVGT